MVGEITENNMADMGTLSADQAAQQQQILRQQRMAEMLMQQGMQQPQGQMVSGRYVAPSITQNLANLANLYVGQRGIEKADKAQVDLANRLRQQGVLEAQDIMSTMRGRQAIPEVVPQGQTLRDDQGMLTIGSQRGVTGIAPDLEGAYAKAAGARTTQGQAFAPLLAKKLMPEETVEERRYKAAVADGSWKPEKMGGFNAFLNQLTEKDKATIANDKARLAIQQQEMAFNLGLPVSGVGGAVNPQAPQTVSPTSPVLAPNQNVAQTPRFNSKAEQDIYVAQQKEKGRLQAEAQDKLPNALNTVNSGLKAIDGMIGDTTVDAKGNLVYGKVKPHSGFSGAVGISGITSGFGAAGFLPATDVTDFKARFKQIEGKSFLSAIESLRGTGAISEVEGAKATAAINRMSLSQSEKEFVEAANELRDVMSKGYQSAQQRAGVKPFNPNAQPNSQTKPNSGLPKLRYNLQTGNFE